MIFDEFNRLIQSPECRTRAHTQNYVFWFSCRALHRKLFRPTTTAFTATLAICRKFCYLKHFVFVSWFASSRFSAIRHAVEVLHFISSASVLLRPYAERLTRHIPSGISEMKQMYESVVVFFCFCVTNEYIRVETCLKMGFRMESFSHDIGNNIMENLEKIFRRTRAKHTHITQRRESLSIDWIFLFRWSHLFHRWLVRHFPCCPNGFE